MGDALQYYQQNLIYFTALILPRARPIFKKTFFDTCMSGAECLANTDNQATKKGSNVSPLGMLRQHGNSNYSNRYILLKNTIHHDPRIVVPWDQVPHHSAALLIEGPALVLVLLAHIPKVKPALKVGQIAEHLRQQEVQQAPQLAQIVLQRRTCTSHMHALRTTQHDHNLQSGSLRCIGDDILHCASLSI